jgi:hypothetical protein
VNDGGSTPSRATLIDPAPSAGSASHFQVLLPARGVRARSLLSSFALNYTVSTPKGFIRVLRWQYTPMLGSKRLSALKG